MSYKSKLTEVFARLLWNNWQLFQWAKIALIVFVFLAGVTLLLIVTLPGNVIYKRGTVMERGYVSTEFGSKIVVDVRTEDNTIWAVQLSKNDLVPETGLTVCIRISDKVLVGWKVASFAMADLCD